MELMGLMVLAFAVAIGVATFIENDFGTVASKAVVYNATWFEVLLVLLAINLIANIFRYKMYRKEKLVIFTFHLSFIIILIGAGITRFIGFEGIMSIREGKTENTMLSDNTYVMAEIRAGGETEYTDEAVLMSALSEKSYSDKASIDGKTFKFKSLRYVPNAQEMLVKGQPGEGAPYAIMVVSTENSGRNNLIIKHGDQRRFLGYNFLFNQDEQADAIQLRFDQGQLQIKTPQTLAAMAMSGGDTDTLMAGSWHNFEMRKLYSMADLRIVLTDVYENGKVDYTSYRGRDMNFMDAMIVEVTSGGETKEIALRGGKGYVGESVKFELNGAEINMMYGAKVLDLPFSLKLIDFQLERYPGSNSPASYASEVVLIDSDKNIEQPYRIFMNNVLNYGGYRFFQSSYDKDELGTVLSVNHDAAGTWVTYLGYFLMSLGMMLAIFVPNTRFALLGRLLKSGTKKAGFLLVPLLIGGTTVFAQEEHNHNHSTEITVVPKQYAAEFGALLVQDHDGRLKPMNTLSSEMLRKVARKNTFNGLTADQVMIGMQLEPEKWQLQKMIKVSHPELKRFLNIRDGSHAAFADFLDLKDGGGYKLRDMVSQAYAKKPAERSKFDNDVIKVDERVNISYLVYTGDLMKVLPDPRDSHNPWFKPAQKVEGLNPDDSAFIYDVIPYYFMSLGAGNYAQATEIVKGIHNFQQKYAADIVPSQTQVKAEILYNKSGVFNRLGNYFGMVGVILLVLVFVQIFKERKWINKSVTFFYAVIVLFFVFQTLGLAIRWYISERAPWSNGYESMIYISWVTVLAGLIFSRKSPMTIAATSILASIILMWRTSAGWIPKLLILCRCLNPIGLPFMFPSSRPAMGF